MQELISKLLRFLAFALLPMLTFPACGFSPERFPLCGVAFRGERGWAFGGAVYSTSDGGETWSLENPRFWLDPDEMPDGNCLQRAAMIDGATGFHTLPVRDYSDAILRKTEDGGKSWIIVNDDHIFGQVFFRDEEFGLANPGLKTVDGGLTWQSLAQAPFLRDVCFFTDGNIFAVAGPTLWKSEDEGESWSAELTLPPKKGRRFLRIQEHEEQLWISGTESFFVGYDPRTQQLEEAKVPVSTSEILDFAFVRESVVLVKPASLMVRLSPSTPWMEIPQPDSVLARIAVSHTGVAFVAGGRNPGVSLSLLKTLGRPRPLLLKSADLLNWREVRLEDVEKAHPTR